MNKRAFVRRGEGSAQGQVGRGEESPTRTSVQLLGGVYLRSQQLIISKSIHPDLKEARTQSVSSIKKSWA